MVLCTNWTSKYSSKFANLANLQFHRFLVHISTLPFTLPSENSHFCNKLEHNPLSPKRKRYRKSSLIELGKKNVSTFTGKVC